MYCGAEKIPNNSHNREIMRISIAYNRKLCDMPQDNKEVEKWDLYI